MNEGLRPAATIAVGAVDQPSQRAQIHEHPRHHSVAAAADDAALGRVVKDAVKLSPLFQTPLIGASHHSRIVCENVSHISDVPALDHGSPRVDLTFQTQRCLWSRTTTPPRTEINGLRV